MAEGVLNFDDDNLKAIAEVYIQEGNNGYRNQEWENALHFYTEGIKVSCKDDELNAKLYSNRATVHFQLGEYQETLHDAKAAIKLQPTFIKAIGRGARACVEQGLYKEAITWCDKGLAINENSKLLLDLKTKSEKEMKSKSDCKTVKSQKAFLGQFPSFMARSPPKDTKESDVTPHVEENQLRAKAELCKNKGNDEYRRHEFSKAEKFYSKGIQVKCKDDELNAKLYNNRATAHFYLGNYLESLDDAKSAIHLQPNYIKAIQSGASACVQLHLYEEAITWCDKGLAIDKENRTLLDLKSKSVDVISKLPSDVMEGEKSEISILSEILGDAFRDRRDYKAAIHYYVRRLRIAEQLGDRAGQGRAHSHLGNAYFGLGNFKAAIKHHERDLEIAIEMKDRAREGRACCNLGGAYHSLGDVRKAIYFYESSLKIDEEVGDIAGKGRMYNNLGSAYQDLGDLEKASDYHKHHLKIVNELGDRAGEAKAYGSLGNIYFRQGNFTKAIEYHECALKIAKELGDRVTEGATYANLGCDYVQLGNFKDAIQYHQLALQKFEKLGNRSLKGTAYGNLGICYENIGETKTAIDFHERRLKIAKEVGDKMGEGNAYGNLGIVYRSLGNFTKAKDFYEQQLKISQEIGDKAGEGNAFNSLGLAYGNLRNFQNAKWFFECSLSINKKLGDKSAESASYANLGNVYHSLGDFKKAIEYHELHLKSTQELGRRAEEGRAYGNLANAYHSLGDFVESIWCYAHCVKITKEVEDKDGLAKTYYNLGCSFEAIGLLDDAFESYKSSIEILNDLRDRLQSRDEWKISLRHFYQVVYNSLWTLLLKKGKVMEALSAAEQGRAQALKDLLELMYGGIKRLCIGSSPANARMPSKIVFIAVHKQEIVFWVIRNGKDVELRRHLIGGGEVKADTFLQSLIESTRGKLGVRSYNMQSCERSGQTTSSPPEIQTHALRTLYDVVIGPVADLIHGSDEIVIVPDGPLFLVPYAALMDSTLKYLGESLRIRVLPSLTSLKLLTECPVGYHCKSEALLVGDPCVKDIVNFDGIKPYQLESAKGEVEMIGRLINCKTLIGAEATKNKVLKQMSSVALVHIAAHGRMGTGEIALAPNHVPESAQVQEQDYLLTMADVLKVKLRAQLVVLSCCHSGRGEIKAEGVVGIARAFLGAGARSVLVTLWAIDDEATLLFMKFFYEHLLQGKRASEALKQAMKCMRESDEFNEVKYWAPFVLIGDDVTLEFGGTE